MFAATAWNNGKYHRSGAGYGLKISSQDRDRYFRQQWKTVQLKLPNGVVATANVDKNSFWNDTCRELVSADIGKWMLSSKFAPWTKGEPPSFTLRVIGDASFSVLAD